MNPLDSPRLKLERACEHLAIFDTELRAFVARNPYHAIREHDPQQGLDVLRLKIAGKPPLPPRFGVLVGDFVSTLRSSLDHLVWAMLTQPPSRPEEVEFPIFGNAAKYSTGAHRRIRLIPAAAQQDIERLQPYHRGNSVESDPLWLIHKLSRIDKHRQIAVIAYGFMYSFGGEGNQRIALTATLADNLKDDPVLPIPPIPASFASQIDFKVEPTFAVVFEKGGPSRGFIPLQALYSLYDYVRNDVFSRLERFVPNS